MKKMRRFISLLLALIMMLAMGMSAMAATITIKNPVKGEIYNAYKIFDVTTSEAGEAGDAADDNYAYTIASDSAWYSAVSAFDTDKTTANTDGLTLTAASNVVNGVTTYNVIVDESQFDVEDFAAALKTALEHNGAQVAGTAKAEDTEVTLNVDQAGYYLVDSTLGTLCALDTAVSSVEVYEKNTVPTITKKVLEDSTNTYEGRATLDVIDKASYQLTVDIGSKFKANIVDDFVITDTLPNGFKYQPGTVKVMVGNTDITSTANCVVSSNSTEEASGTLTVRIGKDYLNTLEANTIIIITYDAKMDATVKYATNGTYTNADGATATIESIVNTNTVSLKYNAETTTDTADVYTHQIDVFKYTGTEKTALAGAKFKLYKLVEGTTYYATADNNVVTGWVTAEDSAAVFESSADEAAKGAFMIKGLDADTYYLKETEAPAGYNKLTSDVEVKIENTETATETIKTVAVTVTPTPNNTGQIEILNETGSLLPTTGGIGTTMFYVVGGALVLVAVVLLVTRKRMDAQE